MGPSAAGDMPSAAGDMPSAAGGTPSAAGGTPSAAGDTPSAAGDMPSAAGDMPSAAGDTQPEAPPLPCDVQNASYCTVDGVPRDIFDAEEGSTVCSREMAAGFVPSLETWPAPLRLQAQSTVIWRCSGHCTALHCTALQFSTVQ